MRAKFSERLASLSEGDISAIIQMAWEDRTAFETIQQRMGWSEPEVIRLMRHELQPNSFRLWRKRMKGRITKHRALRSPDIKLKTAGWRITAARIADGACSTQRRHAKKLQCTAQKRLLPCGGSPLTPAYVRRHLETFAGSKLLRGLNF